MNGTAIRSSSDSCSRHQTRGDGIMHRLTISPSDRADTATGRWLPLLAWVVGVLGCCCFPERVGSVVGRWSLDVERTAAYWRDVHGRDVDQAWHVQAAKGYVKIEPDLIEWEGGVFGAGETETSTFHREQRECQLVSISNGVFRIQWRDPGFALGSDRMLILEQNDPMTEQWESDGLQFRLFYVRKARR